MIAELAKNQMKNEPTFRRKENSDSEDLFSKSFLDLTSAEIKKLAQIAVEKAIQGTWAKGLPVISSIDGRVCQRYSDGRIEWLE